MAVDEIATSLRGLVKLVLVLVGIVVVGGLIAGVADMVIPDLIAGTVLGRNSTASPLAWGIIAAGLLYGAQEVR